jgi:hypothetical protein
LVTRQQRFIDLQGVPVASEHHRCAEYPLILGAVDWLGMSDMHRCENLPVAREPAHRAHHACKGGLSELWKVVRVPAGIDEPELPRGAAELKAIARAVSLDLDAEGRIPIRLREGVTDVLGPADHVHDRYLGGIDRLAEVQCERGIMAQLLSRAHQRDVLAERDAVIRVLQIREIDARALRQRPSAGSLGRGQLHQGAHGTRRNRQITHRFGSP